MAWFQMAAFPYFFGSLIIEPSLATTSVWNSITTEEIHNNASLLMNRQETLLLLHLVIFFVLPILSNVSKSPLLSTL